MLPEMADHQPTYHDVLLRSFTVQGRLQRIYSPRRDVPGIIVRDA